ncbi:MAG: hypothetical protein ABL964_06285 [Steroidobacteraceae bacterium]
MYYDNPALQDFVRWLSATPVSHWLQAVSTSAPVLLATVQTLHLLGMSVVITANGFVAIGLLGGLRTGEGLASLARKVVPWVMTALGVMLVTGAILIVRWPARILLSRAFLPKLVLVGCGTALLLHIARAVDRRPDGLRSRTSTATVLATMLLLVWTAALIAGRWIPFA